MLTTLVAFFIERSRLGLNLMAIREDEDVARTMGVKVVHCKAIAFAVSAALAGLLGAAYAYRAHVIEPYTAFSVEMSAAPIMMAILGGNRNWIGPLIGAVIYDAVSNILSLSIGNEFSDMLFAVFLICVVLLLPDGITGILNRYSAKKVLPEPPSGAVAPIRSGSALHPVDPMSADPLLVINDIHLHFGGVRALNGVSLTVKSGEFLGIIGPNGAGKTTMFNVITGVLKPNSGSVKFDNHELTNPRRIRSAVSALHEPTSGFGHFRG